MRKPGAVLLLGSLCVVAWFAAACVKIETAAAGTATVTGQVVDLMCYAWDRENSGMDHKDPVSSWYNPVPPNVSFACAYSCVRWQGQPAGLLTRDGTLYQIAGGLAADSNVKIAPHLTHTVTITGGVTDVDGVLVIAADDVQASTLGTATTR